MIDDPEYRALLQRLDRLERETPRVRQGTVTAGSPLAVSLGASPTSFDDVRALHGATVDDGAQVAALTFGNDMLVLGGVGPGLGIPLVTSLPSPAFDGQVVDYDTGTAGVVWRFRHNAGSASAYKWEFIGGPALRTDLAGGGTVANNTLFGTAVVAPNDGDFHARWGSTFSNPTGSVSAPRIFINVAGVAQTTTNAAPSDVLANGDLRSFAYERAIGAVAGASIQPRLTNIGGALTVYDTFVSITPVRIS